MPVWNCPATVDTTSAQSRRVLREGSHGGICSQAGAGARSPGLENQGVAVPPGTSLELPLPLPAQEQGLDFS